MEVVIAALLFAQSLALAAPPSEYVVETGIPVPLQLLTSIDTRKAANGDKVYMETTFPVVVNGRIVIPRGSQVIGTLSSAKRPGKVKGRAEIHLRFDSVILPNGVTRDISARLRNAAPGAGTVDRAEGGIKGEGNKKGDARKVGETAATGAGIGAMAGAIAGDYGTGTMAGAAAGAAAGLARVLGSRGPEIVIPVGGELEMVFDRPVTFAARELVEESAQR